jgi:preprotein translocase subunit SecE
LGVRIPPGLPYLQLLIVKEYIVFEKIKQFFKEVKIELKKVTFPSRDEVIGSTKVVLVLVIIVAVFLGLIDMLLSKLIGMIVQ